MFHYSILNFDSILLPKATKADNPNKHFIPLCPSKIEKSKYREDKYPRFIKEAKCICEKCLLGFGKPLGNNYKCMNIFKKKPVIKRTKSFYGLVFWKEQLEEIIFGCVCGN